MAIRQQDASFFQVQKLAGVREIRVISAKSFCTLSSPLALILFT